MADVVGEPIPDYVARQINIRQEAHGTTGYRTMEQLQYLNTKTAWLKLASGVGLNIAEFESNNNKKPFVGIGGGEDLAKRYVLFGGVSSLQNSETLRQRGVDYNGENGRDNVIDPLTGTYNVTARQLKEGQEFGYVPMPGLISAEIRNLNRGSIKKADVKIKCYNKEQFDILDVLYMRLGYTVLLEWGNSFYLDNNRKPERDYYTLVEDPKGIFKKDNTHREMLDRISGYRKAKNGNYDGLLAKVSNFSWEFNTDGTYDITLSLISLGDVIESLKTNVTPTIKSLEFINNYLRQFEESDAQATPIESAAKNNVISANMLYHKLYAKENNIQDNESPEIYYSTLNETIRIGDFVDSKDQTFRTDLEIRFSSKEKAQEYLNQHYPGLTLLPNLNSNKELISLPSNGITALYQMDFWQIPLIGDTEGTLFISNIPVDSNTPNISTSKKDIIYFHYDNDSEVTIEDTGFYMRFGYLLQLIENQCTPKNETSGNPLIKIDYSPNSNKMLCYPNQISYDPQVCLVRSKVSSRDKEIADLFPQLQLWREGQTGYAYHMNIYINFVAIQDAIDSNLDERGNLGLYPFLESICIKLNESLGGVNNLEPVIDEETNTLKIIDGSYSADNKKSVEYELETYGYNPSNNQSNFVRTFNLKTEITPEYATMITIGATAGGYIKGTDATMFSKYNRGIIDRYQEKYISPNIETASNPDEARDNFIKNVYEIENRRGGLLGYKAVTDNARALDPDAISFNLALATEYYKYLNFKAHQRNKEFNPTTIGFIPFNFGITLDGISGIKIYNKLDISTRFLPSNYTDSLKFIIKGVNHRIENQDWETTLETVVVPKNQDLDLSYKHLKELVEEDIASLNNLSTIGGPVVDLVTGPFNKKNCPVLPPLSPKKFLSEKDVIILFKKIFPELSKDGLAGLIGYLNAESRFNSVAFNPAGGGCGAFGIAQWRGKRLNDLAEYAKSQNQPIDSHEIQIKFLKKELTSQYKKVWDLIKTQNLNIYQYTAIPHISFGLGNSNPNTYYKNIKDTTSYISAYTNKGGKEINILKNRIQYAKSYLNLI